MIIDEYVDGRDMVAICREHGVGDRRVFQILKQAGVRKRSLPPAQLKPPLSEVHRSIGARVYDHYFEKGWSRREAADKLGMTTPALRNIELGRGNLTLFDLQDLAGFLKISVGELLGETN